MNRLKIFIINFNQLINCTNIVIIHIIYNIKLVVIILIVQKLFYILLSQSKNM